MNRLLFMLSFFIYLSCLGNAERRRQTVEAVDDYQDDSEMNQEDQEEIGSQELVEMLAGYMADTFPSNSHREIPMRYTDFSRRFVPQYPYDDGKEEELEDTLQNAVKEFQLKNDQIKMDFTPVKASPEVVLAVAKQSQLLTPSPSRKEELLAKEGLRSGDYWNAVWKEDVNPDVLRSSSKDSKYLLPKHSLQDSNEFLKSMKVRLNPNSKLYSLVSILHEHSPRLLYVVNTDSNK